jgi:uncharacterized damage-inducible protein DinB
MRGPIERPGPSEHEAYYSTYIDQVPEGYVLEMLGTQIETTLQLLASVSPEMETHRYASDKWSVREVVGHVIDAERVFTHRAFSFARADTAPIPGMDQDEYAAASNAALRPLAELAAELEAVRRSTLALFRGLPDEAWTRSGIASGFSFSVRSLLFIIVGHEIHHRKGLVENYLGTNT